MKSIFLALFLSFQAMIFAFDTLETDIIHVAVTGLPQESGENAPSWTVDFFKAFEQKHNVRVKYEVVPFDGSWTLASQNLVDVVATGVTALDKRQNEGSTFSVPYLQVKRGLRIHAKDQALFHTIHDFVGHRVGAVEGMTALTDLYNRAPEGVEIVVFKSWDEMYESFYAYEIDAVAEGYYVSVDKEINHSNPDYPMIDDHDLIEGSPEYLVFVIRNESTGLLEALNAFLQEQGFPVP